LIFDLWNIGALENLEIYFALCNNYKFHTFVCILSYFSENAEKRKKNSYLCFGIFRVAVQVLAKLWMFLLTFY